MRYDDPIAFTTLNGCTVHGRFVRQIDADTVAVKVGERDVRVAASACFSASDEVQIWSEIKPLLFGLLITFGALAFISWVWKLML